MDLKKLARLSCLNIKDSEIAFFNDSLTDVFKMMDNISLLNATIDDDKLIRSIELNTINIDSNSKFTKDNTVIDKDKKYSGFLLEDGVFLAPKVIKKD